jgi:predicted PurR-regulated permease PerM
MIWIAVTALAVTVFLGILAAVVWGLGWLLNLLSPVVWPLAIGGILAYLLDPVVDFFARRRISRGLSILLVFALCALAVGTFMASITPRLVREAARLVAEVPTYSKQTQEALNRWMSRRPIFDDWRKRLFPGQVQREQATNDAAVPVTPAPADGATNEVAALPTDKPPDQAHAWMDQISAKAMEWVGETLP